MLQTLRNGVRTTQRSLRRAKLDNPAAGALLESVDAVLSRFEPLRTRKLDARRIRVHGDLHLGQILWNGADVTFIDFEGEPGRPIGERRLMRSPLTDVAGVLRSIDYAGRSALDSAVARGLVADADFEGLDADRDVWTTTISTTFTTAYFNELGDADLVPDDPDDSALLLDVFLLQKGLYEVRYERLVADQEAESRRLLEYIGVDWSDDCLNFHDNARVVTTASMTQVRQRNGRFDLYLC